jgi:hypothetical protein
VVVVVAVLVAVDAPVVVAVHVHGNATVGVIEKVQRVAMHTSHLYCAMTMTGLWV